MTRNYFSKKGGPYFVGQTFSQHPEVHAPKSVSLIGRIKSFFKFPGLRRKK